MLDTDNIAFYGRNQTNLSILSFYRYRFIDIDEVVVTFFYDSKGVIHVDKIR